METAATGDADEMHAALALTYATDPATLARVAAALHGLLGGTLRLLLRERVTGAAAEPLERRTYVLLHHTPAGAR
jgi:hypothetical protein